MREESIKEISRINAHEFLEFFSKEGSMMNLWDAITEANRRPNDRQCIRDAIGQSAERAERLRELIGQTDEPSVHIGRSTLRLLLAEHSVLCDFALEKLDEANIR
jgi:hypothetical protein